MLNIKVENTNLDLLPNTTLSFTINSTIWDFNKITGSYILPFQLPLTPLNQRLLNFPFNPEVESQEDYNCEIYVKGIFFKEGKLSIEEANNNKIKASILINISKISEYADKKLSELDIFGGDQTWTWKTEYFPETDDFALPQIIDENFLGNSLMPGRNGAINQYYTTTNKYMSELACYVYGVSVPTTNFPVIPQPQLINIITKLFNFFGYSVSGNFFNRGIIKHIIILNVNDAITTDYVAANDGFNHQISTFNLKNHLPDITVADFIIALHNFFAIDFNIINNEVQINEIWQYISNDNFIEYTDISAKSKKVKQIDPINGINIKWDTGHPDKNIQVSQFQDAIDANPIRGYYYNPPNNYPEINVIKPNTGYIKYTPDDYETYYVAKYIVWPSTGEIFFGWSGYANFSAEDRFYYNTSQNYFLNIYNDGKILEINLKMFPYATKRFPSSGYDYSIINQPGNSDLNFGKRQSYGLRLAFYMNKNANGIPYMSHHKNYMSLILSDNATSIYKIFWEPVFKYLKTVNYEIEQKLLLSLKQIIYFDFSKKIKIDNKLFFAKSLQFSIDINGNVSSSSAVLMPTYS